MLAYLRLVRLPNVFTSFADIVAGFFIASLALKIDHPPWGDFALLCAASASLYLSGMALNDFADRAEDAQVRPNRPIPSGAVTPRGALACGLGLMLLGLALALCVGRAPLLWAGVLALGVLAYDFALKGVTLAGPLALGVCRFSNVMLGMSAFYTPWALEQVQLASAGWMPWLPAIASGLYGAGVTAFSAQEEHGKSLRAIWLGWLLTGLGLSAVVFVYVCRVPTPLKNEAGFVPLVVLFLQLAQHTRGLVIHGRPEYARMLVLAGVKGYCLLDAAMLMLYGGIPLWPAALAAFLLYFPGGLLRKRLAQREA